MKDLKKMLNTLWVAKSLMIGLCLLGTSMPVAPVVAASEERSLEEERQPANVQRVVELAVALIKKTPELKPKDDNPKALFESFTNLGLCIDNEPVLSQENVVEIRRVLFDKMVEGYYDLFSPLAIMNSLNS